MRYGGKGKHAPRHTNENIEWHLCPVRGKPKSKPKVRPKEKNRERKTLLYIFIYGRRTLREREKTPERTCNWTVVNCHGLLNVIDMACYGLLISRGFQNSHLSYIRGWERQDIWSRDRGRERDTVTSEMTMMNNTK